MLISHILLIFPTDCEDLELLLLKLFINSPNLLVIMFKFISEMGLELITSSPYKSSLRVINTDVGYPSLNEIKAICQTCPKLLILDLRCVDFSDRHDTISGDEVVKTILQCCPLIQMIPIENWPLTDAAIDSLASIHSLTKLSLGDNADCSSLAIQRVLQSNPNLSYVHFTGEFIDDALFSCIGNNCGNLKILYIELEIVSTLTDLAFQDLFRGCPLLVNVELDLLEGVLSNTTLATMFQSCRQLAILKLATDSSPSDIGGEYVLDNCYPSLTELKVNFDAVADSALQAIFTHCTGLRHVSLEDCHQITDETIKILARSCPVLDTLCIQACSLVTLAGTLEMATHCTSLSTLNLISQHISDELLIQLSLHCTSLNTLMLQNYKGVVTEVGIAAVADRCTRLESFMLTANSPGRESEMLLILERMNAKTLYPHIKFIVR